jgi:ABC-type transport system involved in multi-copper enzyme maturation permease subunit
MTSAPTSVDPTVAAGSEGGVSAVPLLRLAKVELRKLTDTRAGMWLLIAIALLTVLAMTLFLFFAHPHELTFDGFVGVAATPQGFLLPVLGILAVTSEWSQRTGLVTFTLEPNRLRVVWAKLLAVALLGVAAILLMLGVAALGNVIGAAWQGGNGAWTFGWVGLRDVMILQLSGLLQGVAFGMLLLITAAAIVIYFVVPIAFSVVFSIVASLKDIAPWLDLGTAQTPLFDHSMHGNDWWQLLVTSVWWIILPLAVGILRVLRSEVKSA